MKAAGGGGGGWSAGDDDALWYAAGHSDRMQKTLKPIRTTRWIEIEHTVTHGDSREFYVYTKIVRTRQTLIRGRTDHCGKFCSVTLIYDLDLPIQ